LNYIGEEKVSYRSILEAQLERLNLKPEKREELEKDLACPAFPMELGYLWQAFLRMHNRRTYSMSANPISWFELDAFIRHSGIGLAPWEVSLLEDIDNLWLAEQNKKR
jgi:hypothetical protein